MEFTTENLQLALLSFGTSGMELVAAYLNQKSGLVENYVNLIGNYYANVLQQHDTAHTALYGPLPVYYRDKNDLLLLIYVFRAYDPINNDPRVAKDNYIVKGQIILFYPANFDSNVRSVRDKINHVLNNWAEDKISISIRKTKDEDLFILQKTISEYIQMDILQTQQNLGQRLSETNIISENFRWLSLISNTRKVSYQINFFSFPLITEFLLDVIFLSIKEKLSTFSKDEHIYRFKIDQLYLNIVDYTAFDDIRKKFKFAHTKQGMMIIYNLTNDNIGNLTSIVNYIMDLSDKIQLDVFALTIYDNRTEKLPLDFLKTFEQKTIMLYFIEKDFTFSNAITSFSQLIQEKI